MIVLEFDMPFPPTSNNLFRTAGKRRVLSKEAKAYRKSVGENLLLQRVPLRRLSGRLAIAVSLYPPNDRPFDIDNRIKALLDALQTFEVFANDNQFDELTVVRCSPHPPVGHAHCMIHELRQVSRVAA